MVMNLIICDFAMSWCNWLKRARFHRKELTMLYVWVLRLFRLGLFDCPSWSRSEYLRFRSAEHEAVAKAVADESITLLKNEDTILPLKSGARLLVTGPNAN